MHAGKQMPSANQRRRRSGQDDTSFCSLNADGPSESLPRPLDCLSAARTYSAELDKNEKSAAREFMWCTTEAVMLRPGEVAARVPIPLGVVLMPFAEGADSQSLDLVDPGSTGILRCPRCRSYVNPFFKWASRSNATLECNMCGQKMEAPDSYLDADGDEQDEQSKEHPELAVGSVEFLAPDESRGVPVTCFVLETTVAAVSSGLLSTALECLEKLLDSANIRRLCVILFDEALHFFRPSMTERLSNISVCCVDDPFVPCHPPSLVLELDDEDGQLAARELVLRLRERAAKAASNSDALSHGRSAAGSALRVAVEVVASCGGGNLFIIHASNPSIGVGALSPVMPDGSEAPQDLEFYREELQNCIKGSVAVSCVTAPAKGTVLDLTTLQWLAWRTGGDALHIHDFDVSLHSQRLAGQLQHWDGMARSAAYDCVFKLRCSKSLSCTGLLAPWQPALSCDDGSVFEVPRLSADASFALTLRPELDYDWDDDPYAYKRNDGKKQLYVQVAVIYTNSQGERLLRLHTSALAVVHSMRAVYQSTLPPPLVAYMLKQAASGLLQQKKQKRVQPKDYLLNVLLQILVGYRRNCYGSDKGGSTLLISKTLSLLPLYMLSARKFFSALDGQPAQTGYAPQEMLNRILRMPIHCIVAVLYPRVHAVHVPDDPGLSDPPGDAAAHSSGEPLAELQAEPSVRSSANAQAEAPTEGSVEAPAGLPAPCPARREQISSGAFPAHFVTNGLGAWLHCDADAPQAEALQRSAAEMMGLTQGDMGPTPVNLALANLPLSEDGVDLWPAAALFVEDDAAGEMTYEAWVRWLGEKVVQSLAG